METSSKVKQKTGLFPEHKGMLVFFILGLILKIFFDISITHVVLLSISGFVLGLMSAPIITRFNKYVGKAFIASAHSAIFPVITPHIRAIAVAEAKKTIFYSGFLIREIPQVGELQTLFNAAGFEYEFLDTTRGNIILLTYVVKKDYVKASIDKKEQIQSEFLTHAQLFLNTLMQTIPALKLESIPVNVLSQVLGFSHSIEISNQNDSFSPSINQELSFSNSSNILVPMDSQHQLTPSTLLTKNIKPEDVPITESRVSLVKENENTEENLSYNVNEVIQMINDNSLPKIMIKLPQREKNAKSQLIASNVGQPQSTMYSMKTALKKNVRKPIPFNAEKNKTNENDKGNNNQNDEVLLENHLNSDIGEEKVTEEYVEQLETSVDEIPLPDAVKASIGLEDSEKIFVESNVSPSVSQMSDVPPSLAEAENDERLMNAISETSTNQPSQEHQNAALVSSHTSSMSKSSETVNNQNISKNTNSQKNSRELIDQWMIENYKKTQSKDYDFVETKIREYDSEGGDE